MTTYPEIYSEPGGAHLLFGPPASLVPCLSCGTTPLKISLISSLPVKSYLPLSLSLSLFHFCLSPSQTSLPLLLHHFILLCTTHHLYHLAMRAPPTLEQGKTKTSPCLVAPLRCHYARPSPTNPRRRLTSRIYWTIFLYEFGTIVELFWGRL